MSETEKTIVEVNGVKLEVDMRYARRIEEIRVGDRVKVLTKKYDGFNVDPGIVIGFEPFNQLPTIIVAYVTSSWSSAEIKFLHYNAKSQDTEIVRAEDDDLSIDRSDIIARFEREIAGKEREIADIREKITYFEKHFRQYWANVAAPEEAA